MNLRLRLLLAVSMLLAVAISALFSLNDRRQSATFSHIEQEVAQKELSRLLAAMESEAKALDQLLLGWAHWSGLYEHVAKPDDSFRFENLQPETLLPSDLAWVAILNNDNQMIDLLFAPPQASTSQRQLLERADSPLRRALAQVPLDGSSCGLIKLEQRLYLSCRRALRDTKVQQAKGGVVVLARPFDEALLRRVENTTQLLFDVKIPGRGGQPGATIGPSLDSAVFGRSISTITSSSDFLLLNRPLLAIDGRPLADLELSVQRQISQLGSASIRAERWHILGVGTTAALLLLLLLEWMLLRPLRRLNQQLQQIQQERDWDQRLPAHGHHELGQLAGHINQLLAINGEQQQTVAQLSLQDALTQLPNRRSFELRLAQLSTDGGGQHHESLLLLIAVDEFKAFNECYGHSLGDAALRQVARALRKVAAAWGGEAMRINGDRFALLISKGRGLDHAHLLLQLQQAIRDLALPHASGDNGQLTISIGFSLGRSDDQPDSLYLRAKAALESALRAGGNRHQRAG